MMLPRRNWAMALSALHVYVVKLLVCFLTKGLGSAVLLGGSAKPQFQIYAFGVVQKLYPGLRAHQWVFEGARRISTN